MEYCAYCGSATPAVSFAPCPSCGNPTNGAPRPVASATSGGGGGLSVALIIVLVVLGVVAIIGILSAIAIPNLLTAMQRSKQKRTQADIRSLATAVETYATDNNEYPRSTDVLSPKYIKNLPTVDGWGHRLEYACITEDGGRCTAYAIRSGGKDMRFEHDDLSASIPSDPRTTTNFDCDIIFSNGAFVEYPEGVVH